jgi:hypothetical protein
MKINGKDIQDPLVSGTNIKTINGASVLGEGNLVVGGGSGGLQGIHTLLKPSFQQSLSAMVTTSTPTAATLIANRLVLNPYIPANSFTAETMYINCTVAQAGSNARILIYSNSNGRPSVKILESSNLSLGTTGVKSYVSYFDFVAGTTYWLAVHGSGGATISHILPSSLIPLYNTAANAPFINYFLNITYGSAPSTLTSITPSISNTPFIGMIAI